jgi:hypothetical protein|tara:strand:+ start:451 stop:564 length:114 start_codon:yes stop_codon:yes gene_type:complete
MVDSRESEILVRGLPQMLEQAPMGVVDIDVPALHLDE